MTKTKAEAWALMFPQANGKGGKPLLDPTTFTTRSAAIETYDAENSGQITYEHARKRGLVKAVRVQVIPV